MYRSEKTGIEMQQKRFEEAKARNGNGVMKKYYPNGGMECGRSALANLLVELNDSLAAQAIYERFRKHELVNKAGTIHGALLPRIIRDLTQETYSGVIYCHVSSDPTLELIELYGEQWKRALEAILEDQDAGIIQTAPPQLSHSCPAIIGIKAKCYPIFSGGEIKLVSYRGNDDHVIVMKSSDTFIDNGFEMTYKLNDLEVISVFEAQVKRK